MHNKHDAQRFSPKTSKDILYIYIKMYQVEFVNTSGAIEQCCDAHVHKLLAFSALPVHGQGCTYTLSMGET